MQLELKVQGSQAELAQLLNAKPAMGVDEFREEIAAGNEELEQLVNQLASVRAERDALRSDMEEFDASHKSAAQIRVRLAKVSGQFSDEKMLAWVETMAEANARSFDAIKAIAASAGFDLEHESAVDLDALREHVGGMRAGAQAAVDNDLKGRILFLSGELDQARNATQMQADENTRLLRRLQEAEAKLQQAQDGAVQLADEAVQQMEKAKAATGKKLSKAEQRVAEALAMFERDAVAAGPLEGNPGVDLVEHDDSRGTWRAFYVEREGLRIGQVIFLGLDPHHSGIGWFGSHFGDPEGVVGGVTDVGTFAHAIEHVLTLKDRRLEEKRLYEKRCSDAGIDPDKAKVVQSEQTETPVPSKGDRQVDENFTETPEVSSHTGLRVEESKDLQAPNGKRVILVRTVNNQPLGRLDSDELEAYWLNTPRDRKIGEVSLNADGKWRSEVNFYTSPACATMDEAIAWVYARDKYTGGTSPADQNKQEKSAADVEARQQYEHAAANPLEPAGDSGSLNENPKPGPGDVTPDGKLARELEPGERRPAVPVNPSAPKVVQETQRGIVQGLPAGEALAQARVKADAGATPGPDVDQPEAAAAGGSEAPLIDVMYGDPGEPLLGESEEHTELRNDVRQAFLAHGLAYDNAQKLFETYYRQRDNRELPVRNSREMTVSQGRHFIDTLLPVLHPVEGRKVAPF